MNKQKSIAIFSFIAILLFVSIYTYIWRTSDNENTSDNPSEASAVSEAESKSDAVTLSNNKFSYECVLNGKLIKLPCSVSDIEACGYTISETDRTFEMESEINFTVDMTTEKNKISVQIYNANLETKPLEECSVVGITVDDNIELYGGLKVGTTFEEVEKIYGTKYAHSGAYSDSEADSFFVYSKSETFRDGIDDEIEFNVKENKIKSIHLYVGQKGHNQ